MSTQGSKGELKPVGHARPDRRNAVGRVTSLFSSPVAYFYLFLALNKKKCYNLKAVYMKIYTSSAPIVEEQIQRRR